MKNPVEQFVRCQFCNKQIMIGSPPSKESYKNSEVRIDSGIMLLPANHKQSKKGSHAVVLDGYYCSPYCLINMIDKSPDKPLLIN